VFVIKIKRFAKAFAKLLISSNSDHVQYNNKKKLHITNIFLQLGW